MCQQCAVQENIHTPPAEGIGISCRGRLCKTKIFKEIYET